MGESDLVKANRLLPIRVAYEIATGGRPAGYGKTYCPFGGIYHKDTRVMSIFEDTNSAYCFLSCGYLTPVRLIEMSKDLTREEAITFAFDHVGYKEPSPEERWDELMSPKFVVDKESLEAALKIYCARIIPDWEVLQFEPKAALLLERCLSALNRVRTSENADKWLVAAKAAMARVNGD